MSVRWRLSIVSIVLILGVETGVRAAETESEIDPNQSEQEASEMYIGAGAVVKGQPYIGVDSKVYPVPLFGYDGPKLYMYGISGGYRLIKGDSWSIGPVFRPRFTGYESDDSDALTGMDDRDWTLDLGVAWSWLTDYGLISVGWVTDVLGRHKGHELEFSYTIMFPLAGFDIIPSVAVQYQSSDLVDYYYGVRSNEEVLPDRPAYEAGGAWNPYLRVAVRRKLNEKWTVLLGGQLDWFDDEIKDSPVVDESRDFMLLGGLLYSF